MDEPLRKIEENSMTTPTKSMGRSPERKSEEKFPVTDHRRADGNHELVVI